MKKTLLTITSVLALAAVTNAQQQVPNGNFEKWDTLGAYINPQGWYTLNELVTVGLDSTTMMTTDAHSGNRAALLETKDAGSIVLPGLLVGGPILDNSFEVDFSQAKIPFTSRPKNLKFWYKAFPATDDSSSAIIMLTRKNIAKDVVDTIGIASIIFKDTVDTYTLAEIPFYYISPLAPDSALILFSSSFNGFDPVPGGRLYIDDMELVYFGVGVEEKLSNKFARVYPNPAAGDIRISIEGPAGSFASLYDQAGRMVLSEQVNAADAKLDVSHLQDGIYFLVLQNGSAQQREKIVINNKR